MANSSRVRGVVLIAAGVLVAGVGGWLLYARSRPAAGPAPAATDVVSNAQHFRNPAGLALEYRAPPGWRLEYHPQKSQLVVIEGSAPLAQASRALFIRSSQLPEAPDVDRMLDGVRQSLVRGFTDLHLEDVRPEVVAGKPGKGFVARGGGRATWQVVVVRGPRRAASLQCITQAELDPREVCSVALDGISWLGP